MATAFTLRGCMDYRTWMLALFTPLVCLADDWPAARVREVFSPSRSHFVRVIPGSSLGDTVGFRGSPKGPFAKAEFYVRQPDASYRRASIIALPNPVAPVEFFVTDRGYLATIDNWHNRGYGTVAAFYRPDGTTIRAFMLSDLFSAQEISRFVASISSIDWNERAYLNPDGRSVYVNMGEGAGLTFDVPSGTYQYCDRSQGAFGCRASNRNRVWKPFRAPAETAR